MTEINFSKKKVEQMMLKNPDRVPIIISSNSFKIDKLKYIVPNSITIGELMIMLRKKNNINPQEAIFLFIKDNNSNNNININPNNSDKSKSKIKSKKENEGILVPSSSTLGTLHHQHKDENLILHIFFEKEAVFGGF